MRDITFSQLEKLEPTTTDDTLQMDQDSFRSLYDRNARPLWVYLWRRTGDRHQAEDLLQETFYRFLKNRGVYESETHQRNYLFRIAANLVNDVYRQAKPTIGLPDEAAPNHPFSNIDVARQNQRRSDLDQAMAKLKPRQRDALWLAYAEGSSHEEVARILGMTPRGIKLLLFRARRKLASLLRNERTRP